jgi:hypothetical protein
MCQETAERLRKPESGTAVDGDDPPHTGLIRVTPSKGRRTSWEPDPTLDAPGRREDVTTLEGIDSTGD